MRIAYTLKMRHHPERTVVLAHPSHTLPFNSTHKTTDPLDAIVHSNTDLTDCIIVSNSPRVLALGSYTRTFHTTKDLLDVVEIRPVRLKKYLGYDPLDIDWYEEQGITEPTTDDKRKAGQARKLRWQWVDDPEHNGLYDPLPSIVENVHIKVGRTGFQNYEIVQDIPELLRLLDQVDTVGWDTETTGLDWWTDHIVGESISIDGKHGYYVPLMHTAPIRDARNVDAREYAERVRPVLATKRLRGFNLGFDVLMACRDGMGFPKNLEDSQVYAYMLGMGVPDPSQNALKPLALNVLGVRMQEFFDVTDGKMRFNDVVIEQGAPYAADDAVESYRLAEVLRARLTEQQRDRFDGIEMPFLYSLIRMQYNGMYLDLETLEPVLEALRMEQMFLMQRIRRLIGDTNIASTQQLQRKLFDDLHLTSTKRTKSGGRSTDAGALESILDEHPVIPLILEYREIEKLINTYLEPLPTFIRGDGRIHSRLSSAFVMTGRINSRDPNLMNIPTRTERGKMLRAMFTGQGDNDLLSCDAGQLEYRVLAHYSGNETLVAAFCDESRDIHRETAGLIFEKPSDEVTPQERDVAKTAFYAILYGIGPKRLANSLGVTFGYASTLMKKIKQNIPEIEVLQGVAVDMALEYGYVESLMGHRSWVWGLKSRNTDERMHAERAAFDSLFQGTGSGDVTKIATLVAQQELDELFPDPFTAPIRQTMQVHDELIWEGPRELLEKYREIPERAFTEHVKLRVPLKAESKIGKSWADVH